MSNKYIKVGMGQSLKKDEISATEEAIKIAQKNAPKGKNPALTIVYTDSLLDQNKICNTVNKLLGKENWIGMSVDKQFNSNDGYNANTTVSIISIYSDYMHFSISYAQNYIKDTKEKAQKAIKDAINHVHSTKNLDSFITFNKFRNKDYMKLIKENQFFVITFASSAQFKNGKETSGAEVDLINGIIDILGISVPIFGGGSGSDFNTFVEQGKGSSYQFAKGKVLEDSAVIAFCVSDLPFEVKVHHAYDLSESFARITKVDKTGYEILEINGKEPISEYCRLIGIKKDKYLKGPEEFSLTRPFGLISMDGNTYVKEALPNKDGKTFHSTEKTMENTIVNIMKHNPDKHKVNYPQLFKEAFKNGPVGAVLSVNCATRRFLMGDDAFKKEMKATIKASKKVPFFGGFVFSEIGSTNSQKGNVHGESITSLVIYDKLF